MAPPPRGSRSLRSLLGLGATRLAGRLATLVVGIRKFANPVPTKRVAPSPRSERSERLLRSRSDRPASGAAASPRRAEGPTPTASAASRPTRARCARVPGGPTCPPKRLARRWKARLPRGARSAPSPTLFGSARSSLPRDPGRTWCSRTPASRFPAPRRASRLLPPLAQSRFQCRLRGCTPAAGRRATG